MVYDNETFEICHPLTTVGKNRYAELLEKEADRIIFKAEHPFKYMFKMILEFFGFGN